MSNSLIPYSFTPGTKAKAQEVNANFIALAEKIEENREFTTTRIAETVEQIEQAASDADEKKVDKNLGNTTLITNCIIEAPNGVVEASENVITVKEGLKVFIPDGFNEDGTVKSIECTIEEDINVTTVKNSYLNCIYLTPTGCAYTEAYSQCESEPYTKLGLWYKASENKSYLYNSDSAAWEEINAIAVALYENTDGIVNLVEVSGAVRLLTDNDRLAMMDWLIPDYKSRVGKSLNATYTAARCGWVYIFGVSQGSQWEHININGVEYALNWVLNGTQTGNTTMVPIKRGDTYRVYGNFYLCAYYFIPMEGDM